MSNTLISMATGHHQIHGAADHTNVAREFFLPVAVTPPSTGVHDHGGMYGFAQSLEDLVTDFAYCGMRKVPDDFVSLTHVHVMIISSGTGNLYWAMRTRYAAAGQSYLTHDAGETAKVATAVTANLVTELPDMSANFASLASGDWVGAYLVRYAGDALDTIGANITISGWLFEYIAEQ